MILNDTITALATPAGSGAIAVIRLSGPEAISIASGVFDSVSGKILSRQASHTIHLGTITDGTRIIDEVLASVFKAPNSYTGEDIVEISCHGSSYIQQELLQLFLRKGCRMADPGEFTLRAFLNGKMDLSQAEAVADLIASDSAASHQLALNQMRGGFSKEIKKLRDELLNFAGLIELELDFSEEDVEFADRSRLENLLTEISTILKNLLDSFATGNVLKNGIPVAIIGEPNVGKSTLMNALIQEERAIVTDIAGTTRDTIEDEITLGGVVFRFIDTAGIRETTDVIESIGIRKTFEKIDTARIILHLFDARTFLENVRSAEETFTKLQISNPEKDILLVLNKTDMLSEDELEELRKSEFLKEKKSVLISAKSNRNLKELEENLLEFVNTSVLKNNEVVVTNARHYEALVRSLEEISNVQRGMDMGLSGDLLAIDLRQALFYLGSITGEITEDDVLGNIFANFCVGK